MQTVDFCRICESKEIIGLGVEKPFYLLNMNKTITIPYAVCKSCQFIFQAQFVGDTFLTEYYNKSLMLRRIFLTDIEAVQHKQQIDFISRSTSLQGKKVLEVGADTGNFLKHLKYGYNCDIFFDELSIDAKKMLIKAGIKDIRDAEDDDQMDVIVMRHVLEHVFDVKGCLNGIKQRLSKDGVLFVEVPDWSYLDEHTDPFIFEHLNHFNSYNLNLLLKQCGFIVDEQEKNVTKEFRTTPNRVLRTIARHSRVAPLHDSRVQDDFHRYYDQFMSIFHVLNAKLRNVDSSTRIALTPASSLTFESLFHSDLQKKNIIGIFDIDERKHGKKVMDISIYPREKLKELEPDIVFVLTIGAFENEILRYIHSLSMRSNIMHWSELEKEVGDKK